LQDQNLSSDAASRLLDAVIKRALPLLLKRINPANVLRPPTVKAARRRDNQPTDRGAGGRRTIIPCRRMIAGPAVWLDRVETRDWSRPDDADGADDIFKIRSIDRSRLPLKTFNILGSLCQVNSQGLYF